MKKVLLAIALTAGALVAHADQKTLSIVWPFGMGDTQAQYSRSLVDELNRNQKKYTFILENKPGAGATIGAKHVAATPNSILASSTAFFVRPNFYPEESHRVADFKPLMTQCAAPMVIVSKRYQSWQDIDPQARVNIGISGLGATSHLMAMEIKKRYPNATPIPYKGTREASIDAANGNLDMSVAFIGEVEGLIDEKKLYALGISGPKPVRGIATLESQGFAGVKEVVNMHSLIVPKIMPDAQYEELRTMVVQAARAESVQRAYRIDHCEASTLTTNSTVAWFTGQIALWKRLSQGVSIGNN
jgi:tripartite-type tricarboxylate transporter receptor subunit TctC